MWIYKSFLYLSAAFQANSQVLIDFGSCQPFGERLQSLGTRGWYEELFFTSEKKHDEFSMRKIKEWLDKET